MSQANNPDTELYWVIGIVAAFFLASIVVWLGFIF